MNFMKQRYLFLTALMCSLVFSNQLLAVTNCIDLVAAGKVSAESKYCGPDVVIKQLPMMTGDQFNGVKLYEIESANKTPLVIDQHRIQKTDEHQNKVEVTAKDILFYPGLNNETEMTEICQSFLGKNYRYLHRTKSGLEYTVLTYNFDPKTDETVYRGYYWSKYAAAKQISKPRENFFNHLMLESITCRTLKEDEIEAQPKVKNIEEVVQEGKPDLYLIDLSISMHLQLCGVEPCMKYFLRTFINDFLKKDPNPYGANFVFFGDHKGGVYRLFDEPRVMDQEGVANVNSALRKISSFYQKDYEAHGKETWIDPVTSAFQGLSRYSKQNGNDIEDLNVILKSANTSGYEDVYILSDFIFIGYAGSFGMKNYATPLITALKNHKVILKPYGTDAWSAEEIQYRDFAKKTNATMLKRIMSVYPVRTPQTGDMFTKDTKY